MSLEDIIRQQEREMRFMRVLLSVLVSLFVLVVVSVLVISFSMMVR